MSKEQPKVHQFRLNPDHYKLDIYDDGPHKWSFYASMVATCPQHFRHCDSNYEVEEILKKHGVIRKNNTTDSETCALGLYFSSAKACINFVKRLNKFIREYRPQEPRATFKKVYPDPLTSIEEQTREAFKRR